MDPGLTLETISSFLDDLTSAYKLLFGKTLFCQYLPQNTIILKLLKSAMIHTPQFASINQKMKKLLIMKHPNDSNFPEGRNNQDLKK